MEVAKIRARGNNPCRTISSLGLASGRQPSWTHNAWQASKVHTYRKYIFFYFWKWDSASIDAHSPFTTRKCILDQQLVQHYRQGVLFKYKSNNINSVTSNIHVTKTEINPQKHVLTYFQREGIFILLNSVHCSV
jgi:hypothetical protein